MRKIISDDMFYIYVIREHCDHTFVYVVVMATGVKVHIGTGSVPALTFNYL